MTTPHLVAKLPELVAFAQHLAFDYQKGTLSNWDSFSQQVRAFYTPDIMNKIESVVPGWNQMASYLDQQTLIHVTSVLVALFLLPEYQATPADHKIIMEWMVMFHDVAKRAERNKHDFTHGFRSAAVTGVALEPLGFPTQPNFADHIANWKALTENALIFAPDYNETIQDNVKLPNIVNGIDALYGQQSTAALIIKGVLFHMSINNDPTYPTLAPLTQHETRQYIDRDFFPILKAMMLADSEAWNLFDTTEAQRLRRNTLEVFDDIGRMNGIA